MNNLYNLEKYEITVFTVCNLAYLPRALILADSLIRHNGDRLKIVIFDKKVDLPPEANIADILWIEDIGVPKLSELAFMYDIIEFSTSLKPFIALKLLETNRAVVFMDPDTCLFSPLRSIVDELQQFPIILTPHYTTPQPNTASESDTAMMRFGSFNLGFFAVDNSSEAKKFLAWWSERCVDLCFMESQFGLSTDQKWVSIAPCFFQNLHISFNLGYNVAPWNTFERKLTKTATGKYMVNETHPLIFFHFSNFDANDPEYLHKRASSEKDERYPALLELGAFYKSLLNDFTAKFFSSKYSYDFMSDGSYISPSLRRAYASVRDQFPPEHDPFDSFGPVGVFGRRNRLISANSCSYEYKKNSINNVDNYKHTLSLVNLVLRLILMMFGPNKFYDFSKLLVFLSSYRKNRGLWKL